MIYLTARVQHKDRGWFGVVRNISKDEHWLVIDWDNGDTAFDVPAHTVTVVY